MIVIFGIDKLEAGVRGKHGGPGESLQLFLGSHDSFLHVHLLVASFSSFVLIANALSLLEQLVVRHALGEFLLEESRISHTSSSA